MDYQEFGGLSGLGYSETEAVDPKDEFFHSIYIAGKSRKNESGIIERPDMLQIRGVEYNKEEVFMIVLHTKQVLVKNRKEGNSEKLDCFSYQEGPGPWIGTSGNTCGKNSAERSSIPFCNQCRAQIICSGILSDENGNPVKDAENKPIFVFIRGKGMKYANIGSYLNVMSKKNFEPIFTPETPESTLFEKDVVNNKRCVTKIGITFAESAHGQKTVFELTDGNLLPVESVLEVLKIQKKTLDKFKEKMDWSLKKSNTSQATQPPMPVSVQEIPDSPQQTNGVQQPVQEKPKTPPPTVSFDDLVF